MGKFENCFLVCVLFIQLWELNESSQKLYTSSVQRFNTGGFYSSVLLGVLQLFVPACTEMCNNITVTFWRNSEFERSQILQVIETKDVCRKHPTSENLKCACS